MKSDLEKAIIAMGEVLKEEGESLDGFDNQTLQDLSTLLAAHVEQNLDRVVH